MTTKKELEAQLDKKLAETREECLTLINALPDEPSGYWKSEYKGKYWYLDAEGELKWDIWNDRFDNLYRLSQVNVFRTRAEAEHHKKKLDVIGKIRLAAMEDVAKNGELDWDDTEQAKIEIIYFIIANLQKINE